MNDIFVYMYQLLLNINLHNNLIVLYCHLKWTQFEIFVTLLRYIVDFYLVASAITGDLKLSFFKILRCIPRIAG